MPQVTAKEVSLERVRVGQITVMREHDPVGRVHVHGLRFRCARAAGSRIANVADARVPHQAPHVVQTKDIAHQTIRLAHVQLATLAGHDSRRVLPAVLKHRKRVVKTLIDGLLPRDADNAAHERSP